jgi:hypothetical protein
MVPVTDGQIVRRPGVPNIYVGLAEHQRTEDWVGRELLALLQLWAALFIAAFKLDVPELALRVDALPASTLGHFRVGHNGFGLRGEVAINGLYVGKRPLWAVLGTLAHECLHAWQHAHGRPSSREHHNFEFRSKAASIGLLIDRRGVTEYLLDSPFMDLLRAHGVAVPTEADCDDPDGDGPRRVRPSASGPRRVKGTSKLAKWSCGCTNVRCAVPDLRATCHKCGRAFERQG